MPNISKRSRKKDRLFFQALSSGSSVAGACQLSGYNRRTVYEWRREDKEFAKAWEECESDGTDLMVDEARRRAVNGTVRPVYYKGRAIGGIREYSDTLLMFLIKGKRPQYREKGPEDDQRPNEQIEALFQALMAGPAPVDEGQVIEGEVVHGDQGKLGDGNTSGGGNTGGA